MTTLEFFELFLLELKSHPEMQGYYKFLQDKSSFDFRKNYFLKRLEFVEKNVLPNPGKLWDCGCGYGTQCLFLAMNGVESVGSTLEFYFESIQKRKDYWSKFGEVDKFKVNYENIFENHPAPESMDYILVGDTLHHLEPISEALRILKSVLKENGKIIIIEENGENLLQRLILYIRRGNKRIIEIEDEKLHKKYLIGNENIRGLAQWEQLFNDAGLKIDMDSVEYVRLLYPVFYKLIGSERVKELENRLYKTNPILRKYFYFGVNFTAAKKMSS